MPPDLWDAIATGGPWAVILAAAIWAGYKRFWMWGWSADERVTAVRQQCQEQVELLNRRVADLQQRLSDLRADHAAELAAVRADKDAQIAREAARVTEAWTRLDHLTDNLDETVTVQQQLARSLTLLVDGAPRSAGSPPPAGRDAAPAARRPRS